MQYDQEKLDQISDYIQAEIVGQAAHYDEHKLFPLLFINRLVTDHKIFHLLHQTVDRDSGLRTFLEVIRLLSIEFSSLAAILMTQAFFAIWLLEHFGSPEQKERYLDDLLNFKKIGAFAFSEEDINLDKQFPETMARQTDKGWIINGRKQMVSNAPMADVIFVLCQTVDQYGKKDMAIFVLDSKTPGIQVGPTIDKVGVRSMPLAPISFENVQLTNDQLLGHQIAGKQQYTQSMIKMRLAISAQSLGIAEGAFKKGLAYSQIRRGFGKRPIDVSINQLRIVDLKTALVACEAYYHDYLRTDMSDEREVSMLKIITSRLASTISEEVVRITGAYSFIGNDDIERYVHDANITKEYGGKTDRLKKKIAEMWL